MGQPEHRPIIAGARTGSISQSTARGAARLVKAVRLSSKPALKGVAVHGGNKPSNLKTGDIKQVLKALKATLKMTGVGMHGSKSSRRSFGFDFRPALGQPKGPKGSNKTRASKVRAKSHR